uniref:HVA22-like protein n=1 Tax=Cymbidium ensifolium TaxID=78740 RepID=A0A3G2CI26_CYMEN|nr:HVA22-like transcript variant X6 [Cymbidium ensifolium]
MMGGFLTRLSVMILGYAYPAYQCYKTVELNKPEIEQLLFWCQYWILVALLSVFERVGDALISWLPLYGEVKLAFFVYLWHPKTKGTTYIYHTFFQPFMSRHENMIDRKLLELRTRAADLAARYWQKALRLGRSRFLEILQYVISQPSSTMANPVEESKQAQPSSTAPPNEAEQPSTSQQPKAEQPSTSQQPKAEQTNLVTTHKPDQAEADDSSPIPPSPASHKPGHGGHSSRSSTPSHLPNPSPPHNAILPQEKLSTTNNQSSSPHSKDTRQEEEEPTRVVRRSRIKKRVSTTATSIH